MSFRVEAIPPGGSAEDSEEYKRAIATRRGLPLGSQVIDRDRNLVLFPSTVCMNEDRSPGEYLFFAKGRMNKIFAYETFGKDSANAAISVLTYIVVDVKIDELLRESEADLIAAMKEALVALGKTDALRFDKVQFEMARYSPHYGSAFHSALIDPAARQGVEQRVSEITSQTEPTDPSSWRTSET